MNSKYPNTISNDSIFHASFLFETAAIPNRSQMSPNNGLNLSHHIFLPPVSTVFLNPKNKHIT